MGEKVSYVMSEEEKKKLCSHLWHEMGRAQM